eukprot:2830686-Prymnesium_polylepis.1
MHKAAQRPRGLNAVCEIRRVPGRVARTLSRCGMPPQSRPRGPSTSSGSETPTDTSTQPHAGYC